MKNKAKQLLSILLVIIMLFGIVPIASMTASADDGYFYTADSWDLLEMYLKAPGTCTIKLTGDIKNEYAPETEGHETINIYGNKTIDLNGYKIECVDSSGIKVAEGKEVSVESEKTMFNVYKGSTLTINDTKGGGEIAFKGEHVKESEHYFHYAKRDVFSVDGTLIVNSGKITAGSQGKEYIYKGEEIESIWTSLYSDWSGNAQQVTWGTAAHVNNGGKLIVNGGELSGRGVHVYQDTNTNKAVMGQRDEVVYIAKGGAVSVNGGSFTALEGANVFAGDGTTDGLKVRAGKFELKKPSTIRVIYDKELYAEHLKYWGLAELVSYATVGSFNIPEKAYNDVYNILSVKYNGKEYKGFSEISALTFDKENYKDGLSLEFAPVNDSSIHDSELELHYGTKVYDNAQTQYEYYIGTADGLKLYCNFDEPYFVDYNSEIFYVWSVWVNDNEGKADYEFFTEENFINPVKLSQADITGKTVFVSCDAYEVGPNASGANHYTNTFKLSPVDKPVGYLEITEEQPVMPAGEKITYVESFTESWDPYNFNHKPLPQELIDAGYCVERVYSLTGLNGTEIPEKTDRGTNRIDFGNMYTDPGAYVLRMGLRLVDKNGNVVDSIAHVFNIFVSNNNNIYELSALVYEPSAGSLPTENVIPEGEGYKTTDVDWSYYNEQYDEYYIMPDGMAFESGKTYECSVQFETLDGYEFPVDKEDVSGYINGIKGVISSNYSATRAYVTVKFTVTEQSPVTVIFTEDSKAETGSKLTVDIDAMVEQSEEFMEAYFEDNVSFQWFLNGSRMDSLTDLSIELLPEYAGKSVYVEVTYGDNSIESDNLVIALGENTTNPPTDPEIPTDPEKPVVTGLLGDANEDGKVNVKDATAIQKHAASLITLSETGVILANVDANATVNVKDTTAIQKYVAGIETGLPIGKAVS